MNLYHENGEEVQPGDILHVPVAKTTYDNASINSLTKLATYLEVVRVDDEILEQRTFFYKNSIKIYYKEEYEKYGKYSGLELLDSGLGYKLSGVHLVITGKELQKVLQHFLKLPIPELDYDINTKWLGIWKNE